ncbi:uncharacterized protein isoform X2 [Leptinotarsa decemlineata]|uniref:uncharacterized protein isoform X2 n=1 Tax=Leptinotarsa decemlineata TaxID=7539 RepID=UPI003D307C1E
MRQVLMAKHRKASSENDSVPSFIMDNVFRFLLMSIGLFIANAYVKEEDFNEKLYNFCKKWHKRCDIIAGISDEELDEIKNGNFDGFDEQITEKIQRYITCLWIGSGEMSPNLEVDLDVVQTFMPEVLKCNGTRIYGKCIEEVKNNGIEPIHIAIWHVERCVFEKDPENFLMC